MEMVETARIWYIDSGANVTFQLFGPIFGSLVLAICKELTRKANISPNMFIISVAYMLWQQLPGILSSFASAMANVGAAGLQDPCWLSVAFYLFSWRLRKEAEEAERGQQVEQCTSSVWWIWLLHLRDRTLCEFLWHLTFLHLVSWCLSLSWFTCWCMS